MKGETGAKSRLEISVRVRGVGTGTLVEYKARTVWLYAVRIEFLQWKEKGFAVKEGKVNKYVQ